MESVLNQDALAEKLDKAYDSPPWWCDLRGFGILKLSYRGSLRSQLSFFERNLGDRHLEVAVGSGTLLSMLLNRRRRLGPLPTAITGVDYSPQMLAGARRRFAHLDNCSLLQCDAAKIPLETGTFDTANIANAIHCVADVPGVLKELHRLLRPGGTLAINALLHPRGPLRKISNSVNTWGQRKGILHAPFSEQEILAHLQTAGFDTVQTFREGNALFVLAYRGKESASNSDSALQSNRISQPTRTPLPSSLAETTGAKRESALSQALRAIQVRVTDPTPQSQPCPEVTVGEDLIRFQDYRIHLANTPSQHQKAWSLAYEVYVSQHQVPANPERLWKSSADGTSQILILNAERGGKTVATLSLVFDGPNGLPADELCAPRLNALRKKQRHLCQIIRMASTENGSDGAGLVAFLFKLAYLAARSEGATDLVATANARHARFYRKVMLFEELEANLRDEDIFVPMSLMHLNLEGADERWQNKYGHLPGHTRYLLGEETSWSDWLKRRYRVAREALKNVHAPVGAVEDRRIYA